MKGERGKRRRDGDIHTYAVVVSIRNALKNFQFENDFRCQFCGQDGCCCACVCVYVCDRLFTAAATTTMCVCVSWCVC